MLIAALVAFGQEPMPLPLDVERFRPAPDGSGHGGVLAADVLEHLQGSFGLYLNHSDDPVVLLRDGRRVVASGPVPRDGVIDGRFRADLSVAVGWRGRWTGAVALPVTLWQQGFEPNLPGVPVGLIEPVPTGVGDLRLFAKASIVEGRRIGVALATTFTLPTGSVRSFLGEGSPTAWPRGVLQLGGDAAQLVFNLGARLKAADRFREVRFGSAVTYGLAARWQPLAWFGVGGGLEGEVAGAAKAQRPAELLGSVRLGPEGAAQVQIGAGVGVIGGVGAPDRRLFGALVFAPRLDPLTLDRDGDGVVNRVDRCPSVPEDLDGFGDEDGCPEDDNDGDGFLDGVDRCPDLPEDVDGIDDHDGCPDLDDDRDGVPLPLDRCPGAPEDHDGFRDGDGCPDADNDGDGIFDVVDRCPMVPEVLNGFQDGDGCPDQRVYLDADRDGRIDEVDRCPSVAEDIDGFEDEDGCPDPDNDGDGILDVVDACPLEPENFDGYQDADGCADERPLVVIRPTRLDLREQVFFETDRAVLRPVSYPLLRAVADILKANPQIRKVRIEGHTDARGGRYYNYRLSLARARAVVQFLVEQGVERDRLEGVGFGETRPIADNRTEEGRAVNRRVEIVIVEREPGG